MKKKARIHPIRVTPALKKWVEQQSKKERRTVSDFVRNLLENIKEKNEHDIIRETLERR